MPFSYMFIHVPKMYSVCLACTCIPAMCLCTNNVPYLNYIFIHVPIMYLGCLKCTRVPKMYLEKQVRYRHNIQMCLECTLHRGTFLVYHHRHIIGTFIGKPIMYLKCTQKLCL